MKVLLAVLVLVAAVQARDWTRLTPRDVFVAEDPIYTAQEWEDMKAKQALKPENLANFVPGTKPQNPEAGLSKFDIKTRIINGMSASRGQFPWQAAIDMDGRSFCGGSLISDRWILTAAHCAYGISTFNVKLGATSVSSNQPGTINLGTRSKVVHSGYNPNTINNDIALIQLPQSVSFNTYINTVALPSYNDAGNSFVGRTVRVSGWGKTSDNSNSISPTLNFVDLTVIDNQVCAQYFNTIDGNKMCTSGAGGRSTCNGDSGGPLVIMGSNGRYHEVGIVSFGSSQGCSLGYPAAFTRVTSYLQWISSYTGIYIN